MPLAAVQFVVTITEKGKKKNIHFTTVNTNNTHTYLPI